MQTQDVVALYTLLLEQGVQVWVDGGWGVDALLGEQTRSHKDLDALVQFGDLTTLTDVLAERGFMLKEIWKENHWVAHPVQLQLIGRKNQTSTEVATAFVLRSNHGHELDFHVLTFDGSGFGVPAWNSDLLYPPNAFQGRGVIAGTPVRCLSAQMQMATHTGYALQHKDLQDLRRLHQRFGIAYLAEHAHYFPKPTT